MDPEQATPEEQPEYKGPRTEIAEFTLNIPLAKSFVYSNVAAFSVSMMDIRISFGEAMPDQSVEPRVGVVLPPENAAYIALALLQQVNIYERNFGPIRHPQWQMMKEQTLQQAGTGTTPEPSTPEAAPKPSRHIKPQRNEQSTE